MSNTSREVVKSFDKCQETFAPVLGGPVRRQFSLRPENGPCQRLSMQSWKLSSCSDTHMTYEWRLHVYPCRCMAHARIACMRMQHACTCTCTCLHHATSHTCNMFTCKLPHASSQNVGSTSCAILCSTTRISADRATASPYENIERMRPRKCFTRRTDQRQALCEVGAQPPPSDATLGVGSVRGDDAHLRPPDPAGLSDRGYQVPQTHVRAERTRQRASMPMAGNTLRDRRALSRCRRAGHFVHPTLRRVFLPAPSPTGKRRRRDREHREVPDQKHQPKLRPK